MKNERPASRTTNESSVAAAVLRPPATIGLSFHLTGAAIGLLAGFGAAFFVASLGVTTGVATVVLPSTGAMFGAFVGAMVSRGFGAGADDRDDSAPIVLPRA